jgi:hypothetical protein
MPYALFCNDAKLSKAYPTEADVWNEARRSGLVNEAAMEEEPAPRRLLDNDYEINPAGRTPMRTPPGTRPRPIGRRWANWSSVCEFGPPEVGGLRRSRDYQGVALASDACSEASATHAFLRCRPRIAPVTFSTFPAGQAASCTKAIS